MAKITQIGGTHYKNLPIQPVEYIHKNGLGFIEGSAIKYLTRWRNKNGIEDLKKARHFIDLLIELETKPKKEWPEDEDRVNVIGSNGNDGLAYQVIQPHQDDFEE